MNDSRAAGFGIRFLASILDVFILSSIISLIVYAINGNFSLHFTNGVTWQLLYTVYLTLTPVLWSGYVLGKRICSIKIKRMDGGNVKLSNMVLREIVGYYLIGFVTFGLSIVISAFMVLFREDKRGIHDIVGGTFVARA